MGVISGRSWSRAGIKVAVVLALLGVLSALTAGPARAADFAVTTTADSGAGSLRQAILDANATDGADRITFDLPTTRIMAPTSELPQITSPLTVDGTTQPGYAGKPLVVLSGASAGEGAFGLDIRSGHSTIKGLVVNGFDRSAIFLSGGEGNVVEGCYLGTDASGTLDRGNATGVAINHSVSNRIGGENPSQANVISGNGYGNNDVLGNLIGTDATGTAPLGNEHAGVRV